MPRSIEELYEIIDDLRSIIERQDKEIKELKASNAQKDAEIASLKKKLYGSGKSEKINPKQTELFDEEEVELKGSEKKTDIIKVSVEYFKKKGKQPKLSKEEKFKHLPTKEEIEYIPGFVKENPDAYEAIGSEVTFEIEPNHRGYSKIVHKRIKFRSKNNRSIPPLIAPAPKQFIQGSIASISWIVQIIMDKYLDHLPLDRQCKIAKRYGVEVSPKNMCDWLSKASEGFEGIYDRILKLLREKTYLQADETPIVYLPDKLPDKKDKQGCEKGYFWLLNDPCSYVYYSWSTDRSAGTINNLLGKVWKGLLQCDGYSAYKSWCKKDDNLAELGSCLVHIRRKFVEAYNEGERKYSPWFIRQIGKLYHWEGQCHELSPTLRSAFRSSRFPIVINLMMRYMKHIKENKRVMQKSKMTTAIRYGLDQIDGVLKCLEDGRIELDNNRIENAVRPTKLGIKNWMFIGHKDAGKRAAIFYTLIENCKRLKIDTKTYLIDVLYKVVQAPSVNDVDYEALLPINWIANKSRSLPVALAA